MIGPVPRDQVRLVSVAAATDNLNLGKLPTVHSSNIINLLVDVSDVGGRDFEPRVNTHIRLKRL